MSTTPSLYASQTVRLFIDGEFVASSTTERRPIVNPATQQVLGYTPFATPDEVNAPVAAAKAAFASWRHGHADLALVGR